MKIAQDRVVGLSFTLTTLEGQLADRTDEPIPYLHGHDNLLPKVEAALEGLGVGDTVDVVLEPADGFGPYDHALVRKEAKGKLPKDVQVGQILEVPDPETGEPLAFRVVDQEGGAWILDGNHPLAGLTLRFEGKVISVREATPKEIAQEYPEGL